MAHDPDTKAPIIARLLVGDTPTAIRKDYPNVGLQTIYTWRGELDQTVINGNKRDRLDDLIEENLALQLQALSNIAAQTRRQEWLDRQSADQLAVLHGVIADKVYRILSTVSIEGEGDIQDATLISETTSDNRR